nr:hypothetical protein [uncultured bacterium]
MQAGGHNQTRSIFLSPTNMNRHRYRLIIDERANGELDDTFFAGFERGSTDRDITSVVGGI